MQAILKNQKLMHSFKELILSINEYCHNYKNSPCALMQVTVKNYDQLCVLNDENQIAKIDDMILATIEKYCSEAGLLKIYEYNKFYYCLLEEIDSVELGTIATHIHNTLVCNLDSKFFADTRIVATLLHKSLDFRKTIRLLCDQTHYAEDHKIFCWIKNPIKQIKGLKSDYLELLELRKSIAENTACFAFQPIIKCQTGEIAYHECLLRLNDVDHKLISAGSYIMLAEKYGYITAVDKYVFEMAIAELRSTNDISLSINISNIGVQDKRLVAHIQKLISDSGVGSRMIIEITETAINDSFEQTKYFVDNMKALGCKIALDDFGAGYTSFNQVRRFSIDIIKIDGSFVRDITTNDKNRVLVETLIKTAQDMGCKTVAEFVESGVIAKQLIDLKVNYMQGNFFSPALNYRSWGKI